MNRDEIDILQELKSIFENINQWLNFAELKHGVIIAYNMAVLGFVEGTLSQSLMSLYYTTIMFLLCGSLIVSIVSFWPSLYSCDKIISFFLFTKKSRKRLMQKETFNLLFYSDIALLGSDEYCKLVSKQYYDNKSLDKKMLKDYIEEIMINSQITTIKYKFVKCSLILSLIPSLLLSLFFICG